MTNKKGSWVFDTTKEINSGTISVTGYRPVDSGKKIEFIRGMDIDVEDVGVKVPEVPVPALYRGGVDEVKDFLQGIVDAAYELGITPTNVKNNEDLQELLREQLEDTRDVRNILISTLTDVVNTNFGGGVGPVVNKEKEGT